MDQPLGLPGFLNDFIDAVIYAESTQFTDELYFNAIFIHNMLGICTNLFRKGLREVCKFKDTDVVAF